MKPVPRKTTSASSHVPLTIRLDHLHPSLAALIMADHKDLRLSDTIDARDLATYRMQQVEGMLREEHGELSALDSEVARSIAARGTISSNPEDSFAEKRNFGQAVADRIATFGGSWTFILSFLGFLACWIALNVIHLTTEVFDPYPFILLNLILSCIAALQAPVIMMSQNRQEAKDRLRSENDYQINLKAELEIRLLHDKLDHVVAKQWERMNEILGLHTDMLGELMPRSGPKKPKPRTKARK